jgi:hypothetical protein
MFFCALIQIGFGLPLLLRSPLRMPITERLFRVIWLGPAGRGFFRIASLGMGRMRAATTQQRLAAAIPGVAARNGIAISAPNIAVRPPVQPATTSGGNGSNDAARLAALEQRVARLEQTVAKD